MNKVELIKFKEEHARIILRDKSLSPNVTIEELIKAYQSEGSVAYTLLIEDIPIICGGIVNLNWKRGEAWLISSPDFIKYKKTCYKIIKKMLVFLAKEKQFRRVQSLVYSNGNNPEILMRHLGFEKEGLLQSYGPDGQDLLIYSRLFNGF